MDNAIIFNKSIVLLTGADGGIGKCFIDELLKNDVKKIYISGLNIDSLTELSKKDKRLIPIKLDITSKEDIENISKKCSDVNCLINNAGIELKTDFLSKEFSQKFDKEIAVNFKGTINLTNEFIDVLKNNEKPLIINILSIASLTFIDTISSYCISKMALHIYCQYLRECKETNSMKIFNIYPGYVDTSLVSDVLIDKISPEELVENICQEIKNGVFDVFPDNMSKKYRDSNKLKIDQFNYC